MTLARALIILALLGTLGCDGGGGGAPSSDTADPPQDTATDTPRADTPAAALPTCDELLLSNAGVPGAYPFTLAEDEARREVALAALAALSEAYSVETINAPSLATFTYTPSWLTTFDLTPVPGDSTASELEVLLEAFLAEGEGLFAFDDAVPADGNGSETDTGHFRFKYTQTYCGEVLANGAVVAAGHPRGAFDDALAWADRGTLVADLRKDGLIQAFSDLLVPALLHAPTNPLVDAQTAAAALAGEHLDAHACFGPGGHVITETELGEVGDPVLLLLEAGDGLQLHLAWPIGIYLEGTTTGYVDALTGAPLAWALHFSCP
jgi:hypothetical protein